MTEVPPLIPPHVAERRSVVLHHVGHGPEHWDVMIEHDGTLLTWRVYHDPLQSNTAQPFFRAPDHRLIYLDYEGPLSGNRGVVRACWRSAIRTFQHGPDGWRIAFHGAAGPSRLTITRGADGAWQGCFGSPDAPA